jgi:hypothetical protein
MLAECTKRRLRPKTVRRLAQKQLSSKECVTAHSPRSRALKMDGTKSAADTTINTFKVFLGREVSCGKRSPTLRSGGSCKNKNPASSNSIYGRESRTPEGQGFLNNVRQLRVSRS